VLRDGLATLSCTEKMRQLVLLPKQVETNLCSIERFRIVQILSMRKTRRAIRLNSYMQRKRQKIPVRMEELHKKFIETNQRVICPRFMVQEQC